MQAQTVNASVAPVAITFSGAETADHDAANGRTTAIRRFRF
jgi:hypothetical protein